MISLIGDGGTTIIGEAMDDVKKTNINRDNQFKKGNPGGPGRPKGSKNKFTLLKEEIVEVWHEEGGKEKLREMFRNDRKAMDVMTKVMLPIMPKEPLVQIEEHTHYEVEFTGNPKGSDPLRSPSSTESDSRVQEEV